MGSKILITGSTGFVGRVITRVLAARNHSIRLLLRSSAREVVLPVPAAETVVTSLRDERGVRAATTGIRTIIHLASAEGDHRRRDLLSTDIQGTRILLAQAKASGVERFIYLSHIGADRGSGFPFLQAKGIVESAIVESGIPALILRAPLIFGAGDSFTNSLALLARLIPAVFFIPETDAHQQPLWVEDLAACMEYCLAEDRYFGEILSIGGPELLSLQQIVEAVLDEIRAPRTIVHVWPPLIRSVLWMMDWTLPYSPINPLWMDYFAVPSTGEPNSLSRLFGLRPARISEQLGYLRKGRGIRALAKYIFQGRQVFDAGGR
jgi:uncharacterized protein YbjT (DUF2867 family)